MNLLLDPAIGGVALALEACLGYPPVLFRKVGHPVTWLGVLLHRLDRQLNREADDVGRRRTAGVVALLVLMLVSAVVCVALQSSIMHHLPRAGAVVILGLLASPCLAQRSLDAHVRAVRDTLGNPGMDAGRAAVAMIVGRDTADLDEAGIARAAIESLAENFSDGIVAPSLFIALGGLPGGVLYKAINTADSMIGHRTPRYEAFGYAAAKLDDIVNWPAARLAGVWIVLAAALVRGASAAEAWRIMRRDAHGHPSPNAGWPEAAMAGALGTRLGGPRTYNGRIVADAAMGDGLPANAATIGRALTLYRLACGLNALAIVAVALVIALWR